MNGENGVRKRIVIDGKNFYLTVGTTFVDCTVPYENRPENLKLRQIVDSLCEQISEVMEKNHDKLIRRTTCNKND
jgi:hypothetical protein